MNDLNNTSTEFYIIMVSVDQVLTALKSVKDPEIHEYLFYGHD